MTHIKGKNEERERVTQKKKRDTQSENCKKKREYE